MIEQTKQTPLNDWHRSHGANMSVFGGYDMPLWFPAGVGGENMRRADTQVRPYWLPAGIRAEHMSVLTACGLFDTSHMSVIRISGAGAFALLQRFFSRDLAACASSGTKPLAHGSCVYGVFLYDNAGVIDDGIVYSLAPDEYLLVVNAGMGDRIVRHLSGWATPQGASVADITDRVGKIDIQGPYSALVMKGLLRNPDRVFEAMPYFSFKGGMESIPPVAEPVQLRNGTPVMISRTGYTGEFGFELFVERQKVAEVWETLIDGGERFGMKPCGLAARDSLRAGAGFPLSHQDIGGWPFVNNPWTFVLPRNARKNGYTKDFIGRAALERIVDSDHTYPFAGFDVRKVDNDVEPASVLDSTGEVIGSVLTCVTDMGIGRADGRIYSIASPDRPDGLVPSGLSCGFVKVRKPLGEGDGITLQKGMRRIAATVVNDIRPDRTARRALREMLEKET